MSDNLFPTHLPPSESAPSHLAAGAIDLPSIKKTLVQSEEQAIHLLQSLPPVVDVGFDTEGTGLNHPDCQMVGMSFYARETKEAFYVPLAHNEGLKTSNVPWTPALAIAVQNAFNLNRMVMHSGGYDQPFFTRRGLNFRKTADTYILGNLLQAQNVGLKDLILEYGLVSFKDVISYKRLIMTCLNVQESQIAALTKDDNLQDFWSFAQIDVAEHKLALDYVCNDAIFVCHLNAVLEDEYRQLVGSNEEADRILEVQYNAARFLHAKSSPGFVIEPTKLNTFITQYSSEVEQQEKDLRESIRQAMGWSAPPKPVGGNSLFDAFGVGQ